jgi:DNA-binding NtrC family response regulator
MKKPAVVVVDADQENGQEFCIVLQGLNYDAVPLTSLEELDQHIRKNQDFTVILNLDSVSADQHFFRAVKKRHPRLYFLGISQLKYHPGLEEVVGSHLYACLVKPLDLEELDYWLKSIGENLSQSKEVSGG